ncbi:heme-binding domain-containing protein [Malonomonas rubra]|uniref:heme-binding domain-containing protein n=1 Tax=Malonomonas rubra TaxID=57040 RepID=UPI0026EF7235|nr:heme-binding domain-containing protein [Malonomonas rubra]
MKSRILIAAVAIIVLPFVIQLIPYGKDHNNPLVISEPSWDSSQTRELFYRACGDCHSHETTWPWYSNYAPVSWLIAHDVDSGREHFNVSAWGVQKKNKADEAVEVVIEGEMPPWFYVFPHPEADLSDRETSELVTGLRKTFGSKIELEK